jgi:SHS2 domain-containing protein
LSPFRIVPHTSEVGLRISGKTWEEFYRAAARGLLALYGAGGLPGKEADQDQGKRMKLSLKGETAEELLVAWFNELNYLLSAKRLLPTGLEFSKAGPKELEAEVRLEPLGARGVLLEREVKSASYYHLKVRGERGEWRATVILDV